MKTKVILALAILCLGFLTYYMILSNGRPYRIAEKYTGFKIPRSLRVLVFEEQYNRNPGRDGEITILFSFTKEIGEELLTISQMQNYSKLPVVEDLPDTQIKNLINDERLSGLYRLKFHSPDSGSYSFALLDTTSSKLLVYVIHR